MVADKFKVSVLAFVLLLGLGLSGCAIDGDRDTYSAGDVVASVVESWDDEPEVDEPELDELPEIEMEEAGKREIEDKEEEPEWALSEDEELAHEYEVVGSTSEQYREWTIEELGEIIAAAGNFWEDWWLVRGRFSLCNLDFYTRPTTPVLRNLVRLLPESGFGSINDIRNYLLQYYTENLLDRRLAVENSIFYEYNNTLFINGDGSAYGLGYTSFREGNHILVEQKNGRAIVQTIGLSGPWHMKYLFPWEEIEWLFERSSPFYFLFINGRIGGIKTPVYGWNFVGRHDESDW